ncbi:tyrosine-type recombinase/integrase [Rhodobacter lacus]|uniref:Tyrosine-type recombinase/integrase n=1 Tax=Rhodobacter lacus TaxID=1641972 RepID=A0ABW5A8T0_9RHOB
MAGISDKGGERLLKLKGNTWWFRRQVPKAARSALDRDWLLVNLQTSEVVRAKRLRDDLEAATNLQFRQIALGTRTALELPGFAPVKLAPSAAERGALSRAAFAEAFDEEEAELIAFAAEAESDALKPSQRKAFDDAYAGRVDVDHHLNEYLAKAGLAAKTVNERRGLIGRFAQWCREKRVKLDRVDRRSAGRYVSEVIDPMHPATQTKHLSALRSYWKFLAQRGHVTLPSGVTLDMGWPWNGQQIEKRGKRVERGSRQETERPFTDDEVAALLDKPFPLNAEFEELMRDVLKVSLLSGMRQAEALTLWVEEVREGESGAGLVFDIQQGKTDAAARKVPIHPDLMEIVERRRRGKGGTEWLFHELADQPNPGDTYGKRFKRWREAVGVDDKREGVRRSLVNFHSARRWFATKADRAGIREAVIKVVIGHVPDKKNVTRASYIAASSGAQMRECVEAVKVG